MRAFVATISILLSLTVTAQVSDEPEVAATNPVVPDSVIAPADDDIESRIMRIYAQIETLQNVEANVQEGVVFLSGSVRNDAQAKRALDLAARLQGVLTVDDNIERSLAVQENVTPIVEELYHDVGRWLRAAPLFAFASAIFLIVTFLGNQLSKWSSLWRRVAPNPFLAELLAQAIRILAIVAGLILALNLLGASALVGTILGGAGVVGLAIGFAVRDSLENYISSIMLSLRQPFRANDHVLIEEHEGKVVRLTSRATVLMTLEGNQLRIPNSTVFKAVILNYTSNPERRFEFKLGVDADDDPLAAIKAGLDALRELPFVLADPEPDAVISAVGDSNIVISFMGWVNQDASDFFKSRSLAIQAVMSVLKINGFTLPEPIYRLRFDQHDAQLTDQEVQRKNIGRKKSRSGEDDRSGYVTDETIDVTPDKSIDEKVYRERAAHAENDLLDEERPVE